MRVTVSIGIAGLSAEHTDSMALLAAADDALYEAKRAGRNCVRVHGAPG
jgi:diguanylate cyclase (GGDEF)-like protein